MKETSASFALLEFLGYIVPGGVMAGAVITIGLLQVPPGTELEGFLARWPAGLLTLLALPMAYFFGLVSSSLIAFTGLERSWMRAAPDVVSPLENALLRPISGEITGAYRTLFPPPENWSIEHYYAIRAAVRHLAPNVAEYGNKQNLLRNMRKNCLVPVWTWGGAVIVFAVNLYRSSGHYLVPTLVGASALSLTWLLSNALKRGMKRNRQLEVRDICLAFVILSKLGKLVPAKEPAGME